MLVIRSLLKTKHIVGIKSDRLAAAFLTSHNGYTNFISARDYSEFKQAPYRGEGDESNQHPLYSESAAAGNSKEQASKPVVRELVEPKGVVRDVEVER